MITKALREPNSIRRKQSKKTVFYENSILEKMLRLCGKGSFQRAGPKLGAV